MTTSEDSSQRRICLFIATEMHLGGAEKSLLTVLEAKDTQGFEVVLLCRPGAEIGVVAKRSALRVVEVEMVQRNLTQQPLAYIKTLIRAFRIVRKLNPAILLGDGWRAVPYTVPLAKVLRRPVVMHLREMDLPPSSITRFLTRQADHVTTISKAQRQFMMDAGIVNEAHSSMIYNGLPLSYLREGKPSDSSRSSFGLESDQLGVVLPGYLARIKGGLVFIEAANQVAKLMPNVRFYFLGGPFPNTGNPDDVGFDQELSRKVSENSLDGIVRFLGHRDDVADVLFTMDIVVVPTIAEEAFGRVAVEAMFAGKPVVASQSGGLPEVVREGETGLIVPKDDASALADAVLQLAKNESLRDTFGRAGQRRAKSLFSDTKKATEMWSVIKEVSNR